MIPPVGVKHFEQTVEWNGFLSTKSKHSMSVEQQVPAESISLFLFTVFCSYRIQDRLRNLRLRHQANYPISSSVHYPAADCVLEAESIWAQPAQLDRVIWWLLNIFPLHLPQLRLACITATAGERPSPSPSLHTSHSAPSLVDARASSPNTIRESVSAPLHLSISS